MRNLNRNRLVMLSPLAEPDEYLAVAASRAGCLGVVNLGYTNDVVMAVSALDFMERHARRAFGVVVDASDVAMLAAVLERRAAGLEVVIVAAGARPDLATGGHQDLADRAARIAAAGLESRLVVTSIEEAEDGARAGFDALIAKGNEAGGWVGEETSFILTQRLIAAVDIPVFVQGGIGLNSAAACLAVGAAGVVLDSQLLLARETRTPASLKGRLDKIDGSETVVVGDGPVARYRRLEGRGALDDAWPVGQDAAFAAPLARQYVSIAGIAKAFRQSCDERLASAVERFAFTPDSPLARQHGTRYPFVQGPMTRTSDTPGFSEAVAAGGGLPFVALALMRGDKARELLSQTRELLGDKPWGAGILGFVPPEVREQQLDAVLSVRPPFALIAGGRPAHAQTYEAAGIKTYLHVPTPGLLRVFLNEGSRRFVFEGRECGGHIGPLTSFVLWESMIAVLLEFIGEQPTADISVLFAGGISDGRSTAMVSVLAAPLVSAGVSVGTLSGTAYLFTDEAVATGAILPDFQRAAVDSSHTTTITAGPGYTTRCLPSPFVAKFESEKLRLTDQAVDPEHLKQELEALNIGRLRIATKGLERLSQGQAVAARGAGTPHGAASPKEEALAQVEPERRWQEGLFMIGQAAALRSQTFSIAELHEELASGAEVLTKAAGDPVEAPPAEPPPEPIAVIGMSAILPGAANLDEYWANILDKVDAVTEVPAHRWDVNSYFDPDRAARDKVYSRWGGFIEPVRFDPVEFGLPPTTLPHIEPFQLLGLLLVRDALADAGLQVSSMPRERTSVIFGAGGPGTALATAYAIRSHLPSLFKDGNALIDRLGSALPEWSQDSFPGFLNNVTAGRAANRFDFGGMNLTVDAACASTLAAVAVGVRELRSLSSDIVIVGGTDTNQDPTNFLSFSKTGALSPTGRTRPFAEDADGMAISEGFAALVLKRLADAESDGDRIYAVIRGVGGASDGRGRSLTAPLPAGQIRAYQRAYRDAGVSPATVGLIEAHGTGTVAGDRAELESLTAFLVEHGAAQRSTAIGSVKSMIGHTKIVAGAAGLIKTVKALHHRVLPPTLRVTKPNPALVEPGSPLYANTEVRPWIASAGSARRAGVSAFGFGGTNFHVVLEEYKGSYIPSAECSSPRWPAELFMWRAESQIDLMRELRAFSDSLSQLVEPRLADLASLTYSAFCQSSGASRLAFVAGDLDELSARLREFTSGHSLASPVTGSIAFLFPGQGSQYIDMAKDLAVQFPEVREEYDLADDFIGDALGRPLSRYMFPEPVFEPAARRAQREALVRTDVAQCALGATAVAQLRLVTGLGIEPHMVAGHSYGELVALYAAGGLSKETLFALSLQRGRAMQTLATEASGAMAAVGAAAADLQPLFALVDVAPANYNSPRQTVISGAKDAVDRALDWCNEASIPATKLSAPAAFHTTAMAAAGEAFAAQLEIAEIARPTIPVYSNLTAAAYPNDPAEIRRLLSAHLTNPVRFVEQVHAMYEAGARTFIEFGPKSVLTRFVGEVLASKPHVAIALDGTGRGELRSLLEAVAALITAGVEVDPARFFAGRGLERGDGPVPTGVKRRGFTETTWLVDGAAAWPARDERPRSLPLDLEVGTSASADRFLDQQESDLIAMLRRREPNCPAAPAEPAAAPASPAIGRYLPSPTPALRGGELRLDKAGAVLVVGGPEPLFQGLLDELCARGYRVVHAPIEADAESPNGGDGALLLDHPERSARELVDRCSATYGTLSAVVYLGMPAREPCAAAGQIAEAAALFALAKEVRMHLGAAASRGGAAFLAVSLAEDSFDIERGGEALLPGDWLVGFMKSIALEWPTVTARAIDLPSAEAEWCAERLAAELETSDDLVEVAWTREGERTAVAWKPAPLPASALSGPVESRSMLRPGSVILATGGARGITAEACEAIAGVVSCVFVLVGTTPLPTQPESAATAALEDEKSIKSAISDELRARGVSPAPKEVESRYRRLLKEREIVATIERLTEAGSRVDYRACDVGVEDDFARLIDSVYEQYGVIDVVIHGAGTHDPKLIEHKDVATFRRILEAKITGADVLSRRLDSASLRGFVLFSSITTLFGDAGQCDYAGANGVLNKLATRLDRVWTGRVVAIDWGPWSGRGMLRPHASRLVQEQGFGLIDVAEGRQLFLRELLFGAKGEPVVLIGGYPDSAGKRPQADPEPWDSELVVLAASSRERLLTRARRLAEEVPRFAEGLGTFRLQDLAHTLNEESRGSFEHPGASVRLAIVATSAADLVAKLERAAVRLDDPSCRKIHDNAGIYFTAEPFGQEARIALLFPGANSQYPRMLEDLARHFTSVKEALAEGQRGLPEMLAADNAMYGIVTGMGIEPDAVAGHSTGKLAALRAAGVFGESATTLFDVSTKLQSAGIELPSATVLAVGLSRSDATALIQEETLAAEIAADNCPHQVIVVVRDEEAPRFLQVALDRGIVVDRLGHDQPFHTERSRPLAEFLGSELGRALLRAPGIPVYSSISAAPLELGPADIAHAVAESMVRPVEFGRTVRRMFEDGFRVFVEVGPSSNLTSFVADTLRGESILAVASNNRARSGTLQLNHMAGMLAAHGISIRLDYLHDHRDSRMLDLGATSSSRSQPSRSVRSDESGVASVVAEYFATMNRFLEVQERVMSAYLGAFASPRVGDLMPAVASSAVVREAQPQEVVAEAEPLPGSAQGSEADARPTLAELLQDGKRSEVAAVLVGIVSDRTGYPSEIIELDADLEGDLGIDSIRRVELVGALLQELGRQGGSGLEALAASRSLGQLLEILEREFGPASAAAGARPESGAERVEARDQPAASSANTLTAEFEVELDPNDEALRDHSLGGKVSCSDEALRATTVVPLAYSLELMVLACLELAQGGVVTGLEQVKANRWIALDAGVQRLRVSASRAVDSDLVATKIHNLTEEASSSYPLGPALEATLRVASQYPAAPARAVPAGRLEASDLDRSEIYQTVQFHGPAWQPLDAIESTGAGGAVARLTVPARTGRPASTHALPHFDSMIIDAVAQTLSCWAHDNLPDGATVLPVGMGSIELFEPAPALGVTLRCRLMIDDVDSDLVTASMEVVAGDRVCLLVRGLRAKLFAVPRQLRSTFLTPGPLRQLSSPLALGELPEAMTTFSEARLLETDLPPEGGLVLRVWTSRILSPKERLRWADRAGGRAGGRETATLHVAKEAVQAVAHRVYGVDLWPGDIDLEPLDGGQFIAKGGWMQDGAPAIEVWTASRGTRFVALASASDSVPVIAAEGVLRTLVADPSWHITRGGS